MQRPPHHLRFKASISVQVRRSRNLDSIFDQVHPYMGGNGRMARFLMNAMMAAGGCPWTVIPLPERKTYMASLKKASVGQDIGPFADFVAHLVENVLPASRCLTFLRARMQLNDRRMLNLEYFCSILTQLEDA